MFEPYTFEALTINSERNYQTKLIDTAVNELKSSKRCLVTCPTGGGKTYMFFKVGNILKPKIWIIFTPRLNLNLQTIQEKYLKLLELNYQVHNFSQDNNIVLSENMLVVTCYQSAKSLYDYCKNIKIDLVVFDEIHMRSTWDYCECNYVDFWMKSKMVLYRYFTTATPKDTMKDSVLWGKTIEEVTLFDLIKSGYLCRINTYIQEVETDNQFLEWTYNLFTQHKKRKCLIFCTTQEKAYNLFKQFTATFSNVNTFLVLSKSYEDISSEVSSEEKAKDCKNNCIVFTCRKIGLGYDDTLIDMVVFNQLGSSFSDISQKIGRGLRVEDKYTEKQLLVLIPVNSTKKINIYLEYLLEHCGMKKCLKSIKKFEEKLLITTYLGNLTLPEYLWNLYHEIDEYQRYILSLEDYNLKSKEDYINLSNKVSWVIPLDKIKELYTVFSLSDIVKTRKRKSNTESL